MANKKDETPKAPEKPTTPLAGDKGTAGLQGKTIDERMADLLADHKRMGAR